MESWGSQIRKFDHAGNSVIAHRESSHPPAFIAYSIDSEDDIKMCVAHQGGNECWQHWQL